ncbi:unnamed protein product [Alopecurus aequalis]
MENAARPVQWSRAYGGSRGPAGAMENAPTKLREVARSARLLRIEGFSLIPTNYLSMDGHFVKTTWSVYGYDWEVSFYPAMKVVNPATPLMPDTWLAVELAFPNTTSVGEARIGARLSCRLVDPTGKLNPSLGDHPGPSRQNIVAFLVQRKSLAKSGYLKHDSVTIECTIAVLMRSPDITVLPAKQAPAPPSNLNLDLAQLQQSKTGADVTFLVSGGESFAAHKLILAARSPVFSAEFFGVFGEKSSQQIQVEGIAAATFKAMLNFIYTDAVSEFDQRSEATTELAQDLLAAADRHDLSSCSQTNKATPRLSEDKVKQCIDPRMKGEYPPKGVAKLAAVAALCVQYKAEFRPNMSIVVKALTPLLTPRAVAPAASEPAVPATEA